MPSMASTALLVLTALLACHHVAGFSWKLCGDGSAKVSKVNLAPDPPAPGNSVTFTVEGTAAKDMDAGSTETDVYFMGFPIWAEGGDLCSSTACPVRSGPVTFTFHRDFPAITPPGNYSVQIHVKPAAGTTEFMCIQVDFEVVPPPSDSLAGMS